MLLVWTLSLFLASCQTAPVELDTEDTTIQYISFQQQPNIRGTYDILTSYIATMTLCIWTALHLNLPVNKRVLEKMPKWKRVFYHDRLRKSSWIAMGLFAPELVVYNAWMQRKHVVKITRWATVAQDLAIGLGIPQAYKWTVYHSWYMLMRGFILRTSETGEPDFIPGSPDFILGSNSMALLSTEVIKEHTKADSVKARTIIRAPWARPLCAFLWMSTDYSTSYRNSPVTNLYPCGQAEDLLPSIYDDDIEYSNFFCFAGQLDGTGAFWPMEHSEGCKAGLKEQQCGERTDREYEKKDEKNVPDDPDDRKPPAEQRYRKHCDDDVPVAGPSPWYFGSRIVRFNVDGVPCRCVHRDMPRTSLPRLDQITSSDVWFRPLIDPMVDHEAFAAIAQPIMRCSFRAPRLKYVHSTDPVSGTFSWGIQNRSPVLEDHPVWPGRYDAILITDHVSDWQQDRPSRYLCGSFLVPAGAIAALTISYGALHACAWNKYFPTYIESHTWRLSSVVIASTGVLLALERLCTAASLYLTDVLVIRKLKSNGSWEQLDVRTRESLTWMPKSISAMLWPVLVIRGAFQQALSDVTRTRWNENNRYGTIPSMCVFVFIAGVFPAARVYVVVESFISLWSMPATIYETLNWPQWLPHL